MGRMGRIWEKVYRVFKFSYKKDFDVNCHEAGTESRTVNKERCKGQRTPQEIYNKINDKRASFINETTDGDYYTNVWDTVVAYDKNWENVLSMEDRSGNG
jgi:hypothetical protein